MTALTFILLGIIVGRATVRRPSVRRELAAGLAIIDASFRVVEERRC